MTLEGYREILEFDLKNNHKTILCPVIYKTFANLSAINYLSGYGNKLNCKECGNYHDLSEIIVEPDKTSSTFEIYENVDKIFEMSWFHATFDKDWVSSLYDSPRSVHLGSFEAALDRALSYYARWGNSFEMFEVKVSREADVLQEVLMDHLLHNSPDHKHSDYDVYRYLNKCEDPGSISLMADSSFLTVTSQRTMSMWEAISYGTVYSLDEATVNQYYKNL